MAIVYGLEDKMLYVFQNSKSTATFDQYFTLDMKYKSINTLGTRVKRHR